MRRLLAREGLPVTTENDSEVAAAYLTYRMRGGDTLGEALEHSLGDLDGFYTFVVGTESGFGVLRDPIACKPPSWRKPTTTSPSPPNTGRWPACRASRPRGCSSRSRLRSISGSRRMNLSLKPATAEGETLVDLATTPLRELNGALHKLDARHQPDAVEDRPPRRPSTPSPPARRAGDHRDRRPVGYYCAGMNKQARVIVHGNAGVGVART